MFFKELLQLNDEEAEILKKQTTSTWDELEARLKGLEDKRRRLAALDFQLGKVGVFGSCWTLVFKHQKVEVLSPEASNVSYQ